MTTKELEQKKENEKYISCEELFPFWYTARIILEPFIAEIKEIEVSTNESVLNISLKLPKIKDMCGEEFYMHEAFPIEERMKIESILSEVLFEFVDITKFEDYLCQPISQTVLASIKSEIYHNIQIMISQGHRTLEEELSFKFGLIF